MVAHEEVVKLAPLAATIWPIAIFPLLGAALAYLIGRVNKDWSGWLATAACACSFLWVLKLFYALPAGGSFENYLFTWFNLGGLKVDFTFRLDALTAVMCLVVTGVGSLIHLYSTGYMHEDESRPRFFSYLNLFMFSMLLLVLGGNLLVLFVGWEGVGLCSYLLIGFWYKEEANARAGRKAFVVNRIGDAGFLLGMFFLIQRFGTLDFLELGNAVAAIGPDKMTGLVDFFKIVTVCLFIGATGKSAQIPLFVWLPDAMAGPTPVSALIHAATMVTAGIYMMARLNFLFSLAPYTMQLVTVVAIVTAFVAGTTALCQNDIKKVLAYSTVSQLGFMFMAAGAGAYWVAVFHLVTHAFFKACLFLGAGSVIHACHHEQDMRHMGGLRKKMPITFWTYLVSTLAISGIAPFSGYYSKHAIIAALSHNQFLTFPVGGLVLLVNLTAFITAFYMTRSLTMTFFGEYRGHAHPHESPWNMSFVLFVLGLLALGGGFLGGDLSHFLSSVLPAEPHHHAESIIDALMHSWLGALGVLAAFFVYTNLRELPGKIYRAVPILPKLFSNKWYFDEVYAFALTRPLEETSRILLWKGVDQVLVDGTVNNVANVAQGTGEVVRRFQTGQIGHYALFIFGGAVIFLMFYMVR